MTKARFPDSLPENDYLSILHVIKKFKECETRGDLNRSVENHLMPLFEAQSALYTWTNKDFICPDAIGYVGIPDDAIAYVMETAPTNTFNKILMKNSYQVCADGVNIPKGTIQKDHDLFFKIYPHYKRKDYPFLERVNTALVATDCPELTLVIGLQRLDDFDKAWSYRDIRVMELLRPHLLQIIKTICLNEELAQYKSVAEVLTDCSTAFALVRPDRLVVFQNQAFEDLIHVNRGKRLPENLGDLLDREISKYDPPFNVEDASIEFPFYTVDKGVFRLSVTLLEGCSEDEGKHFLVSLKPAIKPYSRMNYLMQEKLLSRREMEVAVLAKDGLDDQKIAGRLFISIHTTKNHVKNIHKKLNVQSRRQLVAVLNHQA
jgi:DNA-binding CsgD family transcriptional regulator